MRAATLTQPWCGLMAARIKRIENRSQPFIRRDAIGSDIAFHASREIDESVYARIRDIAPEVEIAVDACTTARWYDLSRITSAIVHVAKLVDILVAPVDDEKERRRVFDAAVKRGTVAPDQWRWWFGRFGYIFRDERILSEPVPCRGWQGCWTLADDLAAKVDERICDECDGSGAYLIDGVPNVCICAESQA